MCWRESVGLRDERHYRSLQWEGANARVGCSCSGSTLSCGKEIREATSRATRRLTCGSSGNESWEEADGGRTRQRRQHRRDRFGRSPGDRGHRRDDRLELLLGLTNALVGLVALGGSRRASGTERRPSRRRVRPALRSALTTPITPGPRLGYVDLRWKMLNTENRLCLAGTPLPGRRTRVATGIGRCEPSAALRARIGVMSP
jgi:hypothetical protein